MPSHIVYTALLPLFDAAHWGLRTLIECVVEWVTEWRGADEEVRGGWLGIGNVDEENWQTS